MRNKDILIFSLIIVGFGLAGVFWWLYFEANNNLQLVVDQAQSIKKTDDLKISELTDNISRLETKRDELQADLEFEQERVNNLAEEIKDATGVVKVLDKLSKTDEELLQKYSKVYFLNEHYLPPSLTAIPDEYYFTGRDNLQVQSKVWPYLEDLLEDAKDDDIDLRIISAYRSFGEQSVLKANYKITYGSGANTFSADQGYSEHQLGTTVDFASADQTVAFNGFETTEAYKWLLDNAYKYGFVLSYPENNTYYQFEPWHWRFVGEDLARDLHQDDKNFYDLDQRKINEYLVDIFD